MKRLILIAMVLMLSSSIAFAQDICESDFDCNGAVDANDVSTFLEDFGRSQFFNPCPPCVPLIPVPKTDQTSCYDTNGAVIPCAGTGQDGNYQLGVERFRNNRDGTVTDNFTGLIWLENVGCFGLRTWSQALSASNGLASGSCGLSDGSSAGDWRLPNIYEILTFRSTVPELHFEALVALGYYFWSSTSVEPYLDMVWTTHHRGSTLPRQKTEILEIWCVRDPL